MPNSFEELYPNITYWVDAFGWIEFGQSEESTSLIRALEEGGVVWEGEADYENLDEALQDLEQALSELIKEYE